MTFDQAYEAVQQYCRKLTPTGREFVSISEAVGRVLAEPIFADRDFPPFPRSTRDGFAFRASDAATVPLRLEVIGQVRAGTSFDRALADGQAVEIMTGAPVPQGADAVVMVEHTKRIGASIEVQRSVGVSENIVQRGSEAKAGQEILSPGMSLAPAHIAVAAAVGKASVQVYKRPRVGILATGDELVSLDAEPSVYQIRNSNTYSLAAQVLASGADPVPLPIAPDEKIALKKLIQQGLFTGLLLLSGGVSMGAYDLVEQVLTELEARFFFTEVQIQPGRPVVFGVVGETPFFGLPGNPLSTMVTFDLFAYPVIRSLGGALPVRLPSAKARLGRDFKTKTGLTRFLPALLRGGLHDPEVEIIPWQGSGDIAAGARANCYAVIPPDRESIVTGEMVTVLLRAT